MNLLHEDRQRKKNNSTYGKHDIELNQLGLNKSEIVIEGDDEDEYHDQMDPDEQEEEDTEVLLDGNRIMTLGGPVAIDDDTSTESIPDVPQNSYPMNSLNDPSSMKLRQFPKYTHKMMRMVMMMRIIQIDMMVIFWLLVVRNTILKWI